MVQPEFNARMLSKSLNYYLWYIRVNPKYTPIHCCRNYCCGLGNGDGSTIGCGNWGGKMGVLNGVSDFWIGFFRPYVASESAEKKIRQENRKQNPTVWFRKSASKSARKSARPCDRVSSRRKSNQKIRHKNPTQKSDKKSDNKKPANYPTGNPTNNSRTTPDTKSPMETCETTDLKPEARPSCRPPSSACTLGFWFLFTAQSSFINPWPFSP